MVTKMPPSSIRKRAISTPPAWTLNGREERTTAARSVYEMTCSECLSSGILTCSGYKPGHTSTRSPGAAASTADWIVVNGAAH